MDSRDNLLEVRNLTVRFGRFAALDGVSFDLEKGETLGIVGESGSGKTTAARVVCGLQKATAGSFALAGRVAMVFQDPLGSLNPRQTIRSALSEVVRCAPSRGGGVSPHRESVSKTVSELLSEVGLDDSCLDKYPHEFSGGQRQRICIAKALALRPDLLICDEAVSALDLSVRATVLDLLADLKKRHSLTMLFITHDLGVVSHIADRVIVMSHGKIVEEGPCGEVLKHPREDYTKRLIASVLSVGAKGDKS